MTHTLKPVAGHRHGRVPRAVREQQLLDVAEQLFAVRGYQGASIEEIAEHAGVTRPIVYNYFGSKDGIYLACLRRARQRLELEIDRAVAAATGPRERLRAGVEAWYAFVENYGPSWDVMFGGGAAVAGLAAAEARAMRVQTIRKIADGLRASFGPGVSDREIEAFAHALSGGGEQLAKWWREHPDLPRAQMVEYHVALFWTGLATLLQHSGAETVPVAGEVHGR